MHKPKFVTSFDKNIKFSVRAKNFVFALLPATHRLCRGSGVAVYRRAYLPLPRQANSGATRGFQRTFIEIKRRQIENIPPNVHGYSYMATDICR